MFMCFDRDFSGTPANLKAGRLAKATEAYEAGEAWSKDEYKVLYVSDKYYVCMYVCMCMYIYIYRERERYTHTCIHTCIHSYVRTYIHMCVYTYIYIYIHTYSYTCIYIYIYMHTSLSLYIYIYICIHIYVCTHMCIYIYIYTQKHRTKRVKDTNRQIKTNTCSSELSYIRPLRIRCVLDNLNIVI